MFPGRFQFNWLKKGRWSSLEILDVVQFSSNEKNKLPLVKTKQYTVILLS